MDGAKFYLVAAAIIALGLVAYKKLSNASYEPIVFMGVTYEHVEDNAVNKVQNHFFTPGRAALDEAEEFIQISKYGHPDLTPQQVRLVQNQVIKSFGLRALDGSEDRFFGLFRGRTPVYGYMRPDAFVLKVGPEYREADGEALRATAGAAIDELARVSTDF